MHSIWLKPATFCCALSECTAILAAGPLGVIRYRGDQSSKLSHDTSMTPEAEVNQNLAASLASVQVDDPAVQA